MKSSVELDPAKLTFDWLGGGNGRLESSKFFRAELLHACVVCVDSVVLYVASVCLICQHRRFSDALLCFVVGLHSLCVDARAL